MTFHSRFSRRLEHADRSVQSYRFFKKPHSSQRAPALKRQAKTHLDKLEFLPAFRSYCLSLYHSGVTLEDLPRRVKRTYAEMEAEISQGFELERVANLSLLASEPDRVPYRLERLEKRAHLKYRRLWHLANMAGDSAKVAVYDVIRHIYLIRRKNGMPKPTIDGRPADAMFVPTLIEIADFVKEHPDYSLSHHEIYIPLTTLAAHYHMQGNWNQMFEILDLLYGGQPQVVFPTLLNSLNPQTTHIHLPLIITFVTLQYRVLKKDLSKYQADGMTFDDYTFYMDRFGHMERLLSLYDELASPYQAAYMAAFSGLRKMCLEMTKLYFSEFDDPRDVNFGKAFHSLERLFSSQEAEVVLLKVFANKVKGAEDTDVAQAWKETLDNHASKIKTFLDEIKPSIMVEDAVDINHKGAQLKWLNQMVHAEMALLEVAVLDYANQSFLITGLLIKIERLLQQIDEIYYANKGLQKSFDFISIKDRYRQINNMIRV